MASESMAHDTWQERLAAISAEFKHPAWGQAHALRVYATAMNLAAELGWPVDGEALLAAAHLHDAGAFAPYRQPGVDHAQRSVEAAGEILKALGFPPEKIPLVREIIRGHMYYASPGERPEALVFHDADALDLLGTIGAVRLLSIVGSDDWSPDLPGAVETIRKFAAELPIALRTAPARELAQQRLGETRRILEELKAATDGLRLL
jgi:uncharacterized protein